MSGQPNGERISGSATGDANPWSELFFDPNQSIMIQYALTDSLTIATQFRRQSARSEVSGKSRSAPRR